MHDGDIHALLFEPGREDHRQTFEVVKGIDNPRLDELFPLEMEHLRMEVELVKGASHTFDMEAFLAGSQTPVFFGSALDNFGIEALLEEGIPILEQTMPAAVVSIGKNFGASWAAISTAL